ncbi:zinc finger protein 436 [Notolabrus celidotus]|uniref:zinc finger protein 436 n=1 Tax=Notolabrus celidotus TaxID=1203425 RepID=UPI00148F7C83|nr:zinc finger protein 436 [Notolabrus celidotus]
MESSSFHSQLLSVMDVLAKAALTEIDRRVDDSCAVLRLEVSQSRRDIDLLRRKCEGMEAELRRTRIRARRRVFYPPAAADRLSPLVRVVLNKETQRSDWDRQNEEEDQTQPQQVSQCADMEPATEAEHILIKVECAEEDMWKNHSADKMKSEGQHPSCFQASQPAHTEDFVEPHLSAENPADSGSQMSPTGDYDTFQDQQPSPNQNELKVKYEREEEEEDEEEHEDAAPLDSPGGFATDEGSGQLWTSNQWTDAADPSSSYAGQQFPSIFPSQSGLQLEDMVSQIQALEKSQSVAVSAARVKRRARTFGSKRPQQEGHSSSQFNSMDHCSISQLSQHPYQDSMPHTGHHNEDLTSHNPAPSCSVGPSRTGLVLARRMRTPWRSALGEKKFSCTFCLKSFSKRCQLKEHLRSHTGERPYSCKLCGRSFAKQCNLIRHAVVHSGEKPHECSLCGKCFTQRSSLKSHQKTAH